MAVADGERRWPEEFAEIREELDALFRQTPYMHAQEFELLDWGLGWATVRGSSNPRTSNLAGGIHGGVLVGLADAAFEVACNSYGRVSVAVELTAHFARAGAPGTVVVARAEESSRSRRLASYRIEVRAADQGEALLASFLALAFRTERWHLGPDRFPEAWRARY